MQTHQQTFIDEVLFVDDGDLFVSCTFIRCVLVIVQGISYGFNGCRISKTHMIVHEGIIHEPRQVRKKKK